MHKRPSKRNPRDVNPERVSRRDDELELEPERTPQKSWRPSDDDADEPDLRR